jgi:hypothetical protein
MRLLTHVWAGCSSLAFSHTHPGWRPRAFEARDLHPFHELVGVLERGKGPVSRRLMRDQGRRARARAHPAQARSAAPPLSIPFSLLPSPPLPSPLLPLSPSTNLEQVPHFPFAPVRQQLLRDAAGVRMPHSVRLCLGFVPCEPVSRHASPRDDRRSSTEMRI